MRPVKKFTAKSSRYRYACVLLLCLWAIVADAQIDWKLKKDEDGIKIFLANNGTAYKSLKVELNVEATLDQLVAFMTDIDRQPEWVYKIRASKLVKTLQPNEFLFYSEVSLPWPLTNRDYVAHIQVEQPSPGLTTIDSRAEPGYMPVREGFVRVYKSITHWEITQVSEQVQKIVYTLNFDLGGQVPPWLVNMFLTNGPSHTFHKLREGVKNPRYKDVRVAYLKTWNTDF
jgi:hypothetical protein